MSAADGKVRSGFWKQRLCKCDHRASLPQTASIWCALFLPATMLRSCLASTKLYSGTKLLGKGECFSTQKILALNDLSHNEGAVQKVKGICQTLSYASLCVTTCMHNINRERDGVEVLDLVEERTVVMVTSTHPPLLVLSKEARLLCTSDCPRLASKMSS